MMVDNVIMISVNIKDIHFISTTVHLLLIYHTKYCLEINFPDTTNGQQLQICDKCWLLGTRVEV